MAAARNARAYSTQSQTDRGPGQAPARLDQVGTLPSTLVGSVEALDHKRNDRHSVINAASSRKPPACSTHPSFAPCSPGDVPQFDLQAHPSATAIHPSLLQARRPCCSSPLAQPPLPTATGSNTPITRLEAL